MFGLDQIYWVLKNSTVSFVYLFIISKILGKKQVAQLEFIDYVVGISLGSIAADFIKFFHYILPLPFLLLNYYGVPNRTRTCD